MNHKNKNTKTVKNEVVKACLKLSDLGYLAGIGGNVAIRVDETSFAVTPSAADYASMKPEDICILDLQTLRVLEGTKTPSVESGMHALVFQRRPDLNASVHTHQPIASAMALLGKDIPLESREERQSLGDIVPVVSYGPSGTKFLVKALAKKLNANRNGYLLRNHGVICGAETIEQAIRNVSLLEKAAAKYLKSKIETRSESQVNRSIKELALSELKNS